ASIDIVSKQELPKIKLFDTYRRGIYEFQPLSDKQVTLYACGPTVYDFAHIGNLRNYFFVDTLQRVLTLNNYNVKHVMNITDVGHLTSDADNGEDKMLKGARKRGQSAWDIAKFFEDAFMRDLALLAIKTPTVICRATEHIDEQITYICALEDQGFTYKTADGIYFDTLKLDSYGHLARLDIAGLQAGKRVSIAQKKNITDFALWKFSVQENDSSERQMQWQSPWGLGFPGWHIECSAMSEKYLGAAFDIHVGGEDHIPVHHSNEIAQCEGRHGKQPANFWMHGYFLQMGDEKISKSGRSLLLTQLQEQGYEALAFRYLLLTSHYRSKLRFSLKALDSATIALKRIRNLMAQWPEGGQVNAQAQQRFLSFVNDDLKMPQAVAVLWSVAKSDLKNADKKATLLYFDEVFALSLDIPSKEATKASTKNIPSEVLALAEQRLQARENHNWVESDALRAAILALGFSIKDSAQGYSLEAYIC
ncbi:MAG: cysteine--tRNA ligase, partial [Oceanospirillaceae bacterium]